MRVLMTPKQQAAALFLLLCSFSVLAVPTGPVIGKVTLVLGSVQGVDQDGDQFEVVRGADLYAGYTLNTGRRSMVRAEMNDGTSLTLSQNGEATLDNFSFDATRSTGGFNATVRRGGFKYASGQLGKFSVSRQHSTISTPAGVIGVRGTVIEATISPSGKVTLRVTEGSVSFITPGGYIDVGVGAAGEVLEVAEDGTTKVMENPPAALQAVMKDLQTLVKQAESNEGDSSYTLTYDDGDDRNDDSESGGQGDLEITEDEDGEPIISPTIPQ
ncbi:MAG: FecR domain-containing protein [Pseudomonadales bacterium]|nr:FecR domain-containing protein [Pseudomonadales bacterium]